MDGRMKEGKTLVSIWEDQAGKVSADFAFDGMSQSTAMRVNFFMDQIKLLLIERSMGEGLMGMGGEFIPGVPDGC